MSSHGRFRAGVRRGAGLALGLPGTTFRGAGGEQLAGRAQAPWGGWFDRHPRALRALALLALAWLTVYLVWRLGWSWRSADLWLWWALLLPEMYGLLNLALLTWFSWRLPETVRPPATPGHGVDVYVCTYDEPPAVLRATLAGCAAMTYPHTTWVLDDGRRPEIAALAAEWGAEYLTRPDNSHAKAGNINNALRRTGGELVLVLDADHVPLPHALDALVGYFDDDDVALVQTPHDFSNHDSVQHYEVGRHEQSVFYSVVCPGKERHGAAFWCGSGAVIRRSALLGVGGVAVETIAEDFHTTIKLHRRGWRSRYHDEVLIQGLAPHDLAAYLLQRDRWARGNLSVFTTPESPLRAGELTARQRLSYFASLVAYLAGPMRLLLLVALVAVLFSGGLPLAASPLVLAVLWAPATFLSVAAGSALCRGYQQISDTMHFELCTAEVFLRALRCIVRPGRTTFRVTPKEGVDAGGLQSLRQLKLVVTVAALLVVGLGLRLAEDAGGPHLLPAFPPGMAGIVIPIVAAVELRRVLRTLAVVARHRQRRIEYRVPVDARVAVTPIGGVTAIGRARDVSPSGVGLELPGRLALGTAINATVSLPALDGGTAPTRLELVVQSARPAGERWVVGTRIVGGAPAALRRVIEYVHVVAPAARLAGDVCPATTVAAPATPVLVAAPAPAASRAA